MQPEDELIGPDEDPCYFCFQDRCVVMLKVKKTFDLRWVPPLYARGFRWCGENGFRMCKTCCNLALELNKDSLTLRADVLIPRGNLPRRERIKRHSFYVAARLQQQVFWLGNDGNKTQTVSIYNHVERSYRVLFDLFNLSLAHCTYPVFHNGVELWCAPHGEGGLMLEEIRSSDRGSGFAGRVLRVVAASADLHRVELFGWVEAHPVDGKPGLTDEELYQWYGRVGFVPDRSQPNLIRRPPRTELDAHDCRKAFHERQAELKHS